jgi:hypothetical protein
MPRPRLDTSRHGIRLSCGKNCDHTEAEHKAFDSGYRAAMRKESSQNSIFWGEHEEDWLAGYSAGQLNREATHGR